MPATIKLQLSLETLIEAITSLDLQEKCRLREVIEQQIFELEEELYEEQPETRAEIQSVRAEYEAGDYLTLDQYLARNSEESS
ncbi:MAG: hypothetical protein AB4372_18645 [Xenococcus sp. (in: cyanobacteria)]